MIEPDAKTRSRYLVLLQSLGLDLDGAVACLEGLETPLQFLYARTSVSQARTAAVTTLLKALHKYPTGTLILATGETCEAADELLEEIDAVAEVFIRAEQTLGLDMPHIQVLRVQDATAPRAVGSRHEMNAEGAAEALRAFASNHMLILGGPRRVLFEVTDKVEISYNGTEKNLRVPVVAVHRAQLMAFPHWLAFALVTARVEGDIISTFGT